MRSINLSIKLLFKIVESLVNEDVIEYSEEELFISCITM